MKTQITKKQIAALVAGKSSDLTHSCRKNAKSGEVVFISINRAFYGHGSIDASEQGYYFYIHCFVLDRPESDFSKSRIYENDPGMTSEKIVEILWNQYKNIVAQRNDNNEKNTDFR